MNKAGCSILLIAVVAIGSLVLHYLVFALAAFRWWLSNGTESTAWVDGFVVGVALLVFVVGFVLIMKMPDEEEANSSDDDDSHAS